MARAQIGSVEIEYETFGEASNPPLLLVMGLGAQMVTWDDDLCAALVDRGFHVIRFDNRDIGLSTKTPGTPPAMEAVVMSVLSGGVPEVPYRLADMAADSWGLLDHLGIDRAHLVGASMGGMIVQSMAIAHQERVLSLTSIMSTTGDLSVGQAAPEFLAQIMAVQATDISNAVEMGVALQKLISGPLLDEPRAKALTEVSVARCFHPAGVAFQTAAIFASPDRTAALRELKVPTLVVHGRVDQLVPLSGGEATAAAIPGARLLVLDEMAHDLPRQLWPTVIDAIADVAGMTAA
jgi:pimeloyl-ACP methyl ester carboxylesterase